MLHGGYGNANKKNIDDRAHDGPAHATCTDDEDDDMPPRTRRTSSLPLPNIANESLNAHHTQASLTSCCGPTHHHHHTKYERNTSKLRLFPCLSYEHVFLLLPVSKLQRLRYLYVSFTTTFNLTILLRWEQSRD